MGTAHPLPHYKFVVRVTAMLGGARNVGWGFALSDLVEFDGFSTVI